MFGVADITGKLKYGQCFIQYQISAKDKRTYRVVQGDHFFLLADNWLSSIYL